MDDERLITPGVRGNPPRGRAADVVLDTTAWLLARRSAAHGILRPVAPTAALLDELDAQFAAFTDSFLAQQATGLADLPEYNLDTGAVDGNEPV